MTRHFIVEEFDKITHQSFRSPEPLNSRAFERFIITRQSLRVKNYRHLTRY